jgi:filamentous hemagglutinin
MMERVGVENPVNAGILLKETKSLAQSSTVDSVSVWTNKARLKTAKLPIEGKIRYVPPKGYNASESLPRGPNNGYLDRFKNEWAKGPFDQPFEWDIQLSNLGKKQLGWASRDGTHINVSLDGKITHR